MHGRALAALAPQAEAHLVADGEVIEGPGLGMALLRPQGAPLRVRWARHEPAHNDNAGIPSQIWEQKRSPAKLHNAVYHLRISVDKA